MLKTVRSLLFVVVALSLLLAACGAPATQTQVVEPTATEVPVVVEPTAAPTEDPMAMYAPSAASGDIITAGSSTVTGVLWTSRRPVSSSGTTSVATSLIQGRTIRCSVHIR